MINFETEERKRIDKNIKKIENWLEDESISKERLDSLTDLLTRYEEMKKLL